MWNSSFSAEEAALFALDLSNKYSSIRAMKELYAGTCDEDLSADIKSVELLYSVLLQDISASDPYRSELKNAEDGWLDIALRAQASEFEDYIVPSNCTVTRLSLGKWFWFKDKTIAKRFWPDIAEEIDAARALERLPSVGNETAELLSPKSKNSYLRLIYALSNVVLDRGLTGKHSSDAEAILKKMELNGCSGLVGVRALADYLKEAESLG